MYPLLRFALTVFKAKRAEKLGMEDVGKIEFYCRPWDLDMFIEMNNGRVLTMYDLGRFDISMRSELWDTLRKNGWGLAVAGSTVRYRKRVKLFDKVEMRTQLMGMDDRWFYIAQSMWVKGEPTSSVLLRTCVTAKGRSVPTDEVRVAMGYEEGHPLWQHGLPDWAQDWSDADKRRPWPPKP